MGQAQSDGSDGKITITVDKELKTLTFSDNGIGMSKDEVDKIKDYTRKHRARREYLRAFKRKTREEACE